MSYQFLLYECNDALVTLTLNRPDRLNALGDTLREELHEAMIRASDDPAVRVIVLTRAGRGFCAGGDMKAAHEVQEGKWSGRYSIALPPSVTDCPRHARLPKPIIAAVNGPVAGWHEPGPGL